MENTFTYIIVFGLLIGFTSLYLFRKDNKRIFPLSVQRVAKTLITVSVEKQAKKVSKVHIEVTGLRKPSHFFIELIDENRNRKDIPINSFLSSVDNITVLHCSFPYDELKNSLNEDPFLFKTFRFGFVYENRKKIKSHELAISKHWNLYRVDSGRYN